jgi:hypothetical protein
MMIIGRLGSKSKVLKNNKHLKNKDMTLVYFGKGQLQKINFTI